MKLDVYQCPVCYYTEHEPAGAVRLFLDKCPRCVVGNMERIQTAVYGAEYSEKTREKMKKLKKDVWKF